MASGAGANRPDGGRLREDFQLYPMIVNWIFGRSLHFVARLDKAS